MPVLRSDDINTDTESAEEEFRHSRFYMVKYYLAIAAVACLVIIFAVLAFFLLYKRKMSSGSASVPPESVSPLSYRKISPPQDFPGWHVFWDKNWTNPFVRKVTSFEIPDYIPDTIWPFSEDSEETKESNESSRISNIKKFNIARIRFVVNFTDAVRECSKYPGGELLIARDKEEEDIFMSKLETYWFQGACKSYYIGYRRVIDKSWRSGNGEYVILSAMSEMIIPELMGQFNDYCLALHAKRGLLVTNVNCATESYHFLCETRSSCLEDLGICFEFASSFEKPLSYSSAREECRRNFNGELAFPANNVIRKQMMVAVSMMWKNLIHHLVLVDGTFQMTYENVLHEPVNYSMERVTRQRVLTDHCLVVKDDLRAWHPVACNSLHCALCKIPNNIS